MSRRDYCQACSMNRFGATSRLECTCGQNIPRKKHEYIPTREELDKYLQKLKELMEADINKESSLKKPDEL